MGSCTQSDFAHNTKHETPSSRGTVVTTKNIKKTKKITYTYHSNQTHTLYVPPCNHYFVPQNEGAQHPMVFITKIRQQKCSDATKAKRFFLND